MVTGVYEKIGEAARSGETFVFCRITKTKGSTPRSTGAVMAVKSDGSLIGSIGGGRPEYECSMKARKMMEPDFGGAGVTGGTKEIMHFDLYPSGSSDKDISDGNNVESAEKIFEGNSVENAGKISDSVAGNGSEKISDGNSVENAGGISDGIAGDNSWDIPDNTAADVVKPDENELICGGSMDVELILVAGKCDEIRNMILELTRQHGKKKVYIFGGGHVARALVPILAKVEFAPVVYESREEFAGKELFPDAEEVICSGFDNISREVKLTSGDYAAIMTRGHSDDYKVLKQILSTDVEYIGLMGSRTKRKILFEKLEDDGFSYEDIDRIHNPIGLDIGSETPEEIAISIAAELIAIRAGVSIKNRQAPDAEKGDGAFSSGEDYPEEESWGSIAALFARKAGKKI